MTKCVEMYAMKFMVDRIVVVGKATQELDHGVTMWLCASCPPMKQMFQPVTYRQEVLQWFRDNFGEVVVIEGSVLE